MFAGDRILPTGIGHTTSCFLQVEGGDEQVIFTPFFTLFLLQRFFKSDETFLLLKDPYLMTESDEELDDSTLLMDKSKAAAADTSSMDSSRRRSVHSISMLGNALSSEKLEPSAKVRIVWPKEKCKMLGQEVVIIDSPGIDVETDLDAWIDRVCLDSDVFVLVANSGEDT